MKLEANDLMKENKLNVNNPNKNEFNSKKAIKRILIAIVIVVIMIMLTYLTMIYIKKANPELTIYSYTYELNSKKNLVLKNDLITDTSIVFFDGDKVYYNIKKVAKYLGYDAHSGEYKIEAEDSSKVFVESKDETASLFLNSNKICKVKPNSDEEYEVYHMTEPAIEKNGEIYIIEDGVAIACNAEVKYDKSKNQITLTDLDNLYNLYSYYATSKWGFKALSEEFCNKKAMIYEKLVVINSEDKYGVLDLKKQEVIGTRYEKIEFNEYNQEFLIKTLNGKVGIDTIDGKTKISVNYEEIKSIYKEKSLYLIKNNGVYGVIDKNENNVIYPEYEKIGIDINEFNSSYTVSQNLTQEKGNSPTNSSSSKNKNDKLNENENEEIITQYIFYDDLIPVKKNNVWLLYSIKNNQIYKDRYDYLGCSNNYTTEKTTNNVLTIDNYGMLVYGKNGKYGLVDYTGKIIIEAQIDDVYYVSNAGVKTYFIVFGGKTYNLEKDIFEKKGINKVNF